MGEEPTSQPLEPWIPNALDVAKVYSAEEIEGLIRTIERLRKDVNKLGTLASISEISKKVREELQEAAGIELGSVSGDEKSVCKAIIHESLDPFSREEVVKKLVAADPEKRLDILAEIAPRIFKLRRAVKGIIRKDTEGPMEYSSTGEDTLRIAFNAARKLLKLKQSEIAGQVGFSDSIVSAVWRGKKVGKKVICKIKKWLDENKLEIEEELKKGKHELGEEETSALQAFSEIE